MSASSVDAVIVGVGELSSRPEPDSSMALHARAIDLALRDAQIPLSDVDGLITSGSRVDNMLMHASALASYLGMRTGQRVLGMPEGETGIANAPFQTRPLYNGKPWFLAAAVSMYKLRDKLNL